MYATDGQTDGRTKATLIAPFPTGSIIKCYSQIIAFITCYRRLDRSNVRSEIEDMISASSCINNTLVSHLFYVQIFKL